MAFNGTAQVKQISDSIVRVTGLSLAGAAVGTFGLAGHTGASVGVALPAAFQPKPYGYGGATVELADSIDASVKPAEDDVDEFQEICVVKTGTTEADFRITFTNTAASESPGLEFYVKFHE